MNSSSLNFTVVAIFSALIAVTSCIATVTHHWSSLRIPEDTSTPLTTATGGYSIQGSYHAGLFQFCMDHPLEGHYKTCYGITMPMSFTCEGPDGDIVRSASSLYIRLTLTRISIIVGILVSLSTAIVSFIGTFKKRKAIYLWCAMALSVAQSLAFATVCILYGHTEGYWYKCGHNQCGGASRCLFSFGYSYGLALACMLLSLVVVGYLWSMRRGLPCVPAKSVGEATQLLRGAQETSSVVQVHRNSAGHISSSKDLREVPLFHRKHVPSMSDAIKSHVPVDTKPSAAAKPPLKISPNVKPLETVKLATGISSQKTPRETPPRDSQNTIEVSTESEISLSDMTSEEE